MALFYHQFNVGALLGPCLAVLSVGSPKIGTYLSDLKLVWARFGLDFYQSTTNNYGILGWVVGERTAATLEYLWERVDVWQCFFSVTDGYKVYPKFIRDGDQIVTQTYMTRRRVERARLCPWEKVKIQGFWHYFARLHRKTLCDSALSGNVEVFNSITDL